MNEYSDLDQSSYEYWQKLGAPYRYSPLEPFNKGSLELIEDVPYPLLGSLKKEELIDLVSGLKRREEEHITEMRNLQKEFSSLKKKVESLLPQSKVIMIEEVNADEAKIMIYEYVKAHTGGIKTTEIAEGLHLSLELVLSSLAKLKKEGKIGKTCSGN
jgi:hypothetical protein